MYYKDIENAEKNYIEVDSRLAEPLQYKNVTVKGFLASHLAGSSDFEITPSTFAIWEVTGNTYDGMTHGINWACIHRANQSTLAGALQYMVAPSDSELGATDNRVLVYNKAYPEKHHE
jgi:hypothetical protein